MSIATWSVEDVARWVARLPVEGAEAIAQSVRTEEIDGETLGTYPSAGRKELKQDLGLSVGKAAKLFAAICELVDGSGVVAESSSRSSPDAASGIRPAEGVPPELSSGGSRTPPSTSRSLRLEPESAGVTASPSRACSSPAPSGMAGELRSMKLTSLIARATAAGVGEEQLEDAEDEADPKEAVIKLILATSDKSGQTSTLRAELSTMKITTLFKRARAVGVSDEELEAAEDEDDDKGAIIELIIGRAVDGSDKAEEAALHAELSSMKLTKLMQRAAAAGVNEQELEAAEDEDDDKGP